MPLSVSVALCTHNGSRFIDEQVRSILDQSHPVDQLVVSDDASSDRTVERVLALVEGAEALDVVVLRSESPLGVTANFARAIAACSGDIVLLSDQDDRWRRDRVSRALSSFLADPELLLVHGDADLIDGSGRPTGLTLFDSLGVTPRDRSEVEEGRAFELFLRRNLVTGAATAFRAGLRTAALPMPPLWLHDEWLALIAAATGGVLSDTAILIDYRQHGSNLVGVARPTLGYRMRRMLQTRSDRYAVLAERASYLSARLELLDVPERFRRQARRKVEFEAVRARYPRRRLARLPLVLRELMRGNYRDLSSQRRLDVLRDLLQPAEPRRPDASLD